MTNTAPDSPKKGKSLLPLWIMVTGIFLVLIGAWSTLIYIAAQNPVETIEVETPAEQP